MRDAFAALGLVSEYGGAHSNGLTHMALLGFEDGSYVELVSTVKAGEQDIPIWKDFIVEDGGPCAWAAWSSDVAAEAKRVSALGVAVQGPFPGGREKPDGTQAQWKLAFIGVQAIGAVLPFLIEDVTPRAYRVKPTEGIASLGLRGVAAVVIGVRNFDEPVASFRRIYRLAEPLILEDREFGAKLAHLAGTPVILAAPPDESGWLTARIDRFGDAPVAFLLGVTDFDAASRHFDAKEASEWFGRRVAWIAPEKIGGTRLGLIE